MHFHIGYHIERPDAVFIAYMELRNLEPAQFAEIEALLADEEEGFAGRQRAAVPAACAPGRWGNERLAGLQPRVGQCDALRERGAVLLDATQKAALQALMWPDGKLSSAVIGQSAENIARLAGLDAVAAARPRVLLLLHGLRQLPTRSGSAHDPCRQPQTHQEYLLRIHLCAQCCRVHPMQRQADQAMPFSLGQ